MAETGRLSKRYARVDTVPSTSPGTWPALHAAALASLTHSFQLLSAPTPMTSMMEQQFGGRWSFLTVLALMASWLTFVVSLLKDFFPSVRQFDLIKTWLTILVVPVEGIVSVLYWGITAYDPTLLVPPGEVYQISLSLDIGLHALPAIFLWADFLLFSPRMSKKAKPLLVASFATALYVTWMEYGAKRNGFYPYPLFNDMSPPFRAIFYVGAIGLLYSLFHVANGIHGLLRTDSTSNEAEMVKKWD